MGAPPPEIVALTASAPESPRFAQMEFPKELLELMRATTWHEGCPAPIQDLCLLEVTYWDFHGRPQVGKLIVNRAVESDVLDISRKLFEHGFMIERMEPVENFGGSDDQSMAANNTSAFNCRDVTGKPGKFSNHSWGRAIDVNPLTNPMILNGKALPPGGEKYRDRSIAWPGSVLDSSFVVKLFRSHGWTWGGEWNNPDNQHFEKTERTEK
jgi:hypothetical protein